MKLKKEVLVVFFMLVMLFVCMAFNLTFTGFFAYNSNHHVWNFTDQDDYIFNSSQINFTSDGIRLFKSANFYQWQSAQPYQSLIISAIRDGTHNDTSKVIALDGQITNIGKKKTLTIKFNHTLSNSDVISFYLHDMPKEVTDYLCPVDVECNSSTLNYGSFTTTSTDDLIQANLSIANLALPSDQFDLYTNDTTKVDFISSVYQEIANYNSTNYTYSNASIETIDFSMSNVLSLGLLTPLERLNNQMIYYQYSTDSGLIWFDVINYNLSSIIGQVSNIRFKALLSTNSTETPVLYNLTLDYYSVCNENWTCSEWSSCQNNSRTRTCIETNGCLSPENRPVENESCGQNSNPSVLGLLDISIGEDNGTSVIYTENEMKNNFLDIEENHSPSSTSMIYQSNSSIISCSIMSGSLHCITQANQVGFSNLTVRYSDSGNLTVDDNLSIIVTYINDNPVIILLPDFEISYDEQLILNLSGNVTDVDSYSFNWSLSVNDTSIVNFTVNNETDVISITPLQDKLAYILLNFTVNDDMFAVSSQDNVLLKINPIETQSTPPSSSGGGGGGSSNAENIVATPTSPQAAVANPGTSNQVPVAEQAVEESSNNEGSPSSEIPLTGMATKSLVGYKFGSIMFLLIAAALLIYYFYRRQRKQKVFKFESQDKEI